MEADPEAIENGRSIAVITYGMGVYWAMNAAKKDYKGQVEVVDLRSLVPLDEERVFEAVRRHNKCLVVTEEPVDRGFPQALAGKVQKECFQDLDAPVDVLGAENVPAIPLNSVLEGTMIPNADKVGQRIGELLAE
jgi:2-oxoisovalerate dehydrogenase E1 component